MDAQFSAPILPMKTAGTQHLIERTYRESSPYQWVRELLVNALEAKATRVEFGIEWQAVESQGVYRRIIADNGCGMNAEQLEEFFNTFGGGGKPIGGLHENFGVGSKTSLLPWNRYGMVVISWVNGDATMIWVTRHPESLEYGLKLEECDDSFGDATIEHVYLPYNDPKHGCDWSAVKPDWIHDHGTVVVLLGNSATTNTVEGDPSRDESDIKGISSYLNRRIWQIPDGVEVFVDELRTSERSLWPSSEDMSHGTAPKDGPDRRTNTRRIEGAKHYIEYPSERFDKGELGGHGVVPLNDGTDVEWYLWNGERPKVHSYAAISGYIGALYKNELYDVAVHHGTYRSFGVSESSVRQRLWLILKPVVDPEGRHGVYPRTDRSSLLIKGGSNAGGSLPINDWSAEFADKMPDEILDALRAARHGSSGTVLESEWREKLAERFGSRWRLTRFRYSQGGPLRLDPSEDGIPLLPRARKPEGPSTPRPTIRTAGSVKVVRAQPIRRPRFAIPGTLFEGEEVSRPGGLPSYRIVQASDVPAGIIAAWQPNDPECPEGVVLINSEHPVLRLVIEHWQAQYAEHHAEAIANDVLKVYGEVAVSKIAHSEHLRKLFPSHVIDERFRSDEALTMSLLGLMAEDHLISTRVGGRYSKKRYAVSEDRRTQRPIAPR